MVVMLGDCEQALARNIAPAKDVLQKGNRVLAFFGTTKGDDQQRVVFVHRFGHKLQPSVGRDAPSVSSAHGRSAPPAPPEPAHAAWSSRTAKRENRPWAS